MKKKQKQNIIQTIWEFIKLQLAGNILFWGTLGGTALFHEAIGLDSFIALVCASIIAHIAFFIVDKSWVFSDKTGRRKTTDEIWRFLAFMGLNFFINLGLNEFFKRIVGIDMYWSQFAASLFFTIWNYVGLKFWVFPELSHESHHRHAFTLETKKAKERYRAQIKYISAKQKAKRTA